MSMLFACTTLTSFLGEDKLRPSDFPELRCPVRVCAALAPLLEEGESYFLTLAAKQHWVTSLTIAKMRGRKSSFAEISLRKGELLGGTTVIVAYAPGYRLVERPDKFLPAEALANVIARYSGQRNRSKQWMIYYRLVSDKVNPSQPVQFRVVINEVPVSPGFDIMFDVSQDGRVLKEHMGL